MNPFEERARGRKVAKLVRELWRQRTSLIERGVPHTEEQFAKAVERFGAIERKQLALQAGCRPPSDETWAEVIAIFCRDTIDTEGQDEDTFDSTPPDSGMRAAG